MRPKNCLPTLAVLVCAVVFTFGAPALAAAPSSVTGSRLDAHDWESVLPAPREGMVIIDTFVLALRLSGAGLLTGTWTEESKYPGGIVLNGTECAGCKVRGVYYNRFRVTGSIHKTSFSLEVHDKAHVVIPGGLGPNLPADPQVGCRVAGNSSALWLLFQDHVYMLWPEGDYAGYAIGGHCRQEV
jgi:hypothetical protein